MQKIIARTGIITTGVVLTIAALTGCSASQQTNADGSTSYTNEGTSYYTGAESGASTAPFDHYSFYQKLPGNKRVLCIWADDNSNSGGISCDWGNAESIPN